MNNPTGTKDRRLGRGLAALLGTPLDEDGNPLPETVAEAAPAPAASSRSANERGRAKPQAPQPSDDSDATPPRSVRGIVELSVYEIDNNPFQPRREFNPSEIESLANSLKRHEQLQPVLVRSVGDRYQLISGERRLRAAIHAGLKTVRAEIREADDRLVAELAIIENLQRKDLNAVEKAMSFRRYIDQHGCTQEDLASRLSIDRSTVANLMRLLELPQQILDGINAERLSAGHARALLPLGDEDQQIRLAKQIEEERWSVRATEHQVAEILRSEDEAEAGTSGKATVGKNKKRTVTPQIASLQQELRMQLGTKVEIREASRGRGKITIHFANADEFDRLRQIFQGEPAAAKAG